MCSPLSERHVATLFVLGFCMMKCEEGREVAIKMSDIKSLCTSDMLLSSDGN